MKNNIKLARENKGYTQQECADLFGVKLRAWQTYEQGVSEPKYELLCKIADTFGVTTDYLLGREPAPDPLSLITAKVDDEKFVELYSSLPEYAKSIFIDTMEKLAQAKKEQTQKKHRAYMETTLGAIEEQNELASEEEGSA